MAKIANVALSNTFDTWRTRSNESFDRLSQFAVNNSSLYANTVTANTSFTSKGTSNLGDSTSDLTTIAGRATVGTNLTVSGNTSISGTTASTSTTTGALVVGGGLGVAEVATIATLNVTTTIKDSNANYLSQTLTDGATVNWDASLGRVATLTLGGNRTVAAPTNLKVGTYILHVVQDGTGSRTITWNGVFKWPAAVAPTLTTTASRRDIMTFVSDGTNLYGTYINDVR